MAELDELFDRLTEGKGGHKYEDGFTEENWEEVWMVLSAIFNVF